MGDFFQEGQMVKQEAGPRTTSQPQGRGSIIQWKDGAYETDSSHYQTV